MQVNPYLSFNGNCEEAFKFYEQRLGGKIDGMFKYAGSPMEKDVPPEWRNKVLHARLKIGDKVLMGSDTPPDRYETTKGFSMSIETSDAAEADRLFQTLGENGTVTMPIQKTFWAARFGMLVDRFGIPWMVNCEQGATATP
jgi:PhnB protein